MKKGLIVWGGWDGHEPQKVASIFSEILEKEGFDVEVSNTLDSFGDKDKLMKTDLIVPVWSMGELKDGYIENIMEAVEKGTAIAGCHGGMNDAFRNSTEWQFLTGSQWVAHPGGDRVEYTVNIRDKNSFLTKGLNDFKIKSEQYYIHIDPAVKVYAATRFPVADGPHAVNGEVDIPVVYTKLWGKGRIFYSSLGHIAKDFDIYEVKEIIRRGFIWATDGGKK